MTPLFVYGALRLWIIQGLDIPDVLGFLYELDLLDVLDILDALDILDLLDNLYVLVNL